MLRSFLLTVLVFACAGNAFADEPVKVFILAGQSNMQGHGKVIAEPKSNGGKGSLEWLVKNPETAARFKHLVDANGQWIVRADVQISYLERKGNLAPGFGFREGYIGPELGFGQVVGDAFEEPVLLIKLAWGGKSLAKDFRPPSSGGEVGPYYKELLKTTKDVLKNAQTLFPQYADRKLELAGFGWHQGWNDRVNQQFNDEYEQNLANFIRDIRKDLGAPNLPFVIAETGMSGREEKHPRALSLMKAQAAVAKYEEFKDNTAFVGTKDFFRPKEESPSGQAYHWNSNAETYYLIGEAMGKAMVELIREPSQQAAKPFHIYAPSRSSGKLLVVQAERRPNVVLILADDVGCEPLGCYGGESYQTPNLDKLAAGGMRFRHCYSMAVCHPTRTTLLTGRYPFRLGHPGWGSFPKTEEQIALPHALKRAGYKTAVAGKWQLTLLKNDLNHPHRLGFDEYCLFGWHEGPRYYSPLIWQNGEKRTGLENRYGPDVYVEFLSDFMKANRDRPFFAFYSMALCHDVTDDLKEPVPFGPEGHYDTYAQMIASMDQHVGQLVKAIDDLGLRENTLILFTGDNGTSQSYIHTAENGKYVRKPVNSKINGELVRGGKGKLTNSGTNVPLIANWKGKIPPGQVVDDLIDMSDFLPTAVDLARGKLPKEPRIDGLSFAQILLGNPTSEKRMWAFAEHGKKAFVRTARFKLYDDGRLFDVTNDVDEKSPIKPENNTPESKAARKMLMQAMSGLNYPGK